MHIFWEELGSRVFFTQLTLCLCGGLWVESCVLFWSAFYLVSKVRLRTQWILLSLFLAHLCTSLKGCWFSLSNLSRSWFPSHHLFSLESLAIIWIIMDRVLLKQGLKPPPDLHSSRGWSWSSQPPASISWVLGLQLSSSTPCVLRC